MKSFLDSSKVELITNPRDKVELEISKIFNYSDYEISKLFYDQYPRLDKSEFVSLIESNNQVLGFLNLVDEKVDNTLFLDIAVMKEFRNQQLGKKAIMKMLESYNTSKYLIAETQIDNVSAKRMLNFFGDAFYQEKDRVYYFIENVRTCNDFLNEYSFEQLKEKAKVKTKSRIYKR